MLTSGAGNVASGVEAGAPQAVKAKAKIIVVRKTLLRFMADSPFAST
jgi:hypothetical protein